MKAYKSHDEYAHRFGVWKENRAAIKAHNLSKKSWSLAINKFGDLTQEEFAEMYLSKYETEKLKDIEVLDTAALPTTVDWVAKGAVTQVKNQGQCGSCWSFSTTGSVEGLHFLEGNQLVSLSEQQLMDCSTKFGNMGCNGGLMDDAFKYIISAGGLESEEEYPYLAFDQACKADSSKFVASISGYKNVTPNSVDQLMAAVSVQPTSIAVDASGLDWQFYLGGVIDFACGTSLDHGVLAVGYETKDTLFHKDMPVWKVKNSWGADWGDGGYLYIERSSKNECGVLSQPSFPTGKTFPPSA